MTRQALGKGLSALLKDREATAEAELRELDIDLLEPNPFQPRQIFADSKIEELSQSIRTHGFVQPLIVRKELDRYQIVAGERRWRAAQRLGLLRVPALVKTVSNEKMLEVSLIENIQREKLNAIEVGTAYKRLMDECHLTQEQIAERVGKDRTTVANTIRLLKLPQKIQDALAQDKITSGHARALINLDNEALQLQLLENILSKNLSVRKVERLVRELSDGGTRKIKKAQTDDGGKALFYTPNLRDVEDKLRVTFGTKVKCIQRKDGTGEIVLEYYSRDEFERLIELFEIINKNYN